jgi:hypothetical protein
MLTGTGIYRPANALIHKHGEDADLKATTRADAVLETQTSLRLGAYRALEISPAGV